MLASSLAAALRAGRNTTSAAPAALRAISAGQVRVSAGPWSQLPEMATGVYLENLYLEMPDGVRLNAFL
ncbi:MAG: hypothetical protein AAGG11_05655 [Pseudomonadota bacterium]